MCTNWLHLNSNFSFVFPRYLFQWYAHFCKIDDYVTFPPSVMWLNVNAMECIVVMIIKRERNFFFNELRALQLDVFFSKRCFQSCSSPSFSIFFSFCFFIMERTQFPLFKRNVNPIEVCNCTRCGFYQSIILVAFVVLSTVFN